MQIRDASALVTGAGRGIGRKVALALAREGARLTVVSRNAAELDSLVSEIEAAGSRGVAFAGDLRNRSACDGAVAAAASHFGGLQLLVNNAGVGQFASVEETDDQTWDDVIGTNLTAVFRLTRAAIPHLARGGGQIVMISSLAGQNPIAGMATYCASKAALDHFTACLMLEVRPKGIRVTTIAPGSVTPRLGPCRARTTRAGSSARRTSPRRSWTSSGCGMGPIRAGSRCAPRDLRSAELCRNSQYSKVVGRPPNFRLQHLRIDFYRKILPKGEN